MADDSVRTSLDLPRDLHRRLHARARARGCSARKLILESIERLVDEPGPRRPARRLKLTPPLIRPAGRRLAPDYEKLYDLLELP
ncbi:MAG: hypothetical protein ACTHJX_01730 [Terriglobales bacterium]|jgi:hypothetical protein